MADFPHKNQGAEQLNAPVETPREQQPVAPQQEQTPQTEVATTVEQFQNQEIEAQREQSLELKKQENFLDETIGNLKEKLRGKKKKPKAIPQVRDEVTVQIEHIMEEGLKDAYNELTPVQKQEFKIKGEKVALEIRQLLKKGKVKVKNIFKLIVEWLKMLPGVNTFFAEQEAKIKADKIISMNRK